MESYIPSTFSNTKAKKSLFNSACSRAVKDGEAAHKQYRSHRSAETHAPYIYSRNHAKSILQITKISFINRNCQNLSHTNSSRNFWHLSNTISNNFTSAYFPPLLQIDGSTVVSSFSKAELFAQTFATNSTMNCTEHITPIHPPSDYFIPKIRIHYYGVLHVISGLIFGKLTVRMDSCCSQKTCFQARLLPSQTLSSVSFYFYHSFFLEICSHPTCL